MAFSSESEDVLRLRLKRAGVDPGGWISSTEVTGKYCAEDARFIGEIDAVVDQVLRNSKRMNALIFFWEQWIPAQPHRMVSMSKFHPYFHSSPRTPVQDLESLLRGFGPV